MITQLYLVEHYDYRDGELYSKRTGNKIGGPNGSGRIKTVIHYKYYYLHRLIWLYHTGVDAPLIDHIDQNVANNRFENLRAATPSQSSCNKKEANASGFRGVDAFGKRWRAKIRHNNVHIHIGYFDTPEEASVAYKAKAIELHKEFACLDVKIKDEALCANPAK